MTDQQACDHSGEYQFDVAVNTIEDPTRFTFAEIRVRCSDCEQLFHWHGIASGHPNPNEPTTTADGYALRAPIRPGPGAVVGLLVETGMVDRLVKPES